MIFSLCLSLFSWSESSQRWHYSQSGII